MNNANESSPFYSTAFNAQSMGIVVSLLIHLCFILAFLATPITKIVPHMQTIQLSFYSQPEFSSANQPPNEAKPKEHSKIVPMNNVQAVVVQQAHKSTSQETNVLIPSQVIVANKALPDENPVAIESQNMAVVPAKSDANQSNGQVNLHSVSSGNIQQGIYESKFGDTGSPAFIRQEIPVYPAWARRLGKEGRVMLKLLIDANGNLQNVEVVEAAGFGFTEASVEAVKKSTYAPGYNNGEKVATKALLPVRFRLQ